MFNLWEGDAKPCFRGKCDECARKRLEGIWSFKGVHTIPVHAFIVGEIEFQDLQRRAEAIEIPNKGCDGCACIFLVSSPAMEVYALDQMAITLRETRVVIGHIVGKDVHAVEYR